MLITRVTAPSYETLRPLRSPTSSTFPVYHQLGDTLSGTKEHPDPIVAHVMATCAAYAYSGTETVSTIMARMGLPDNQCLSITESVDVMFICSTGFLVQSRDGRVLILCYRGTQLANLVSWLTDFDVSPERVSFPLTGAPNGEVHGGFHRNVRATRYQVIAAVQRAVDGGSILDEDTSMPNPLEALYITGHSLGGAMAALMAVMIRNDPAFTAIADRLRAVYTFGQPMIGTQAFADVCAADEFLSRDLIRYIYRHDIVPQLPPAASGPFAHFGQEYQYRRNTGSDQWVHNTQPTRPLWSVLEVIAAPLTLLSGAVRILRNAPFPASLEDHLPQHYISALTPEGVRSEFGD